MPLITIYSTDKGIQRLMTAMRDLGARDAWSNSDKKLDAARAELQELFGNYLKLLKAAYDEAVPWWENTINAQRSLGLDDQDALKAAFNNRLAGAASDPRVVWVVRLVWLSCMSLNAKFDDTDKVRPEVLLLQWLIDAGETELVRLIACMPYWPIGLDENGNWC
jgi:hypothetical protein